MIENFATVEAEIYGGVPDVPLKITCSLNVDASFWLQMFSAKLMLHKISMQFLMIGIKCIKNFHVPLNFITKFCAHLVRYLLMFGCVFLFQYWMFTQLAFVEVWRVAKTAVKRNKTWPEEAVWGFVFFPREKISLDKCWEHCTGATAPRSFYRGSC